MEIIINCIEIAFGIGVFVNASLLIPQIIKLLKEKHANDISLITFAGFVVFNIITVLHGVIVRDKWLVIGFSCSILTSGIVTILIIWYRRKSRTTYAYNKNKIEE